MHSILDLAQEYFKLLNDGNVETAKRIFHENCSLFHVKEGAVSHVSLAEYLAILKDRESPKSRGEPIFGQVVSIDQSDADTAFLKVRSAVQPRYFEDYLTLLREGGRWLIVAKVYRVVADAK